MPYTSTPAIDITDPGLTVVFGTNPVPNIFIDVPPIGLPQYGTIFSTVGGTAYRNPPPSIASMFPGTTTFTVAGPGVPEGVTARHNLLVSILRLVAALSPTYNTIPFTKLSPVIVIGVPPCTGPICGNTSTTFGNLALGIVAVLKVDTQSPSIFWPNSSIRFFDILIS